MHQDHIGLVGGENTFHALQNGCGYVSQILAGFHDIQVEIRLDTKQAQHLVQHFPMLSGHADLGVEVFIGGQGQGKWGHLDSLGASAENTEGFDLHGELCARADVLIG
ncbi:hypothetical protein D9M68_676980 [compost metagenome]